MLINDEQIKELTVDEYFFLTENFEITNNTVADEAVSFLVYNKKRKMNNIVKTVIENELTTTENNLIIDYLINQIPVTKISEKYNMSRSSVYRNIENIKKKLYGYLKYVVQYDSLTSPKNICSFDDYLKGGFSIEH